MSDTVTIDGVEYPAEPSYIVPQLRCLAVPIDSLNSDPANARLHPPENRAATKASLIAFGQYLPLVVQRASMIVRVGNNRLSIAKELGWKYVAAVVTDHPDDVAKVLAIADNRTGEGGQWDEHTLKMLLGEIKGDPALLTVTGFDAASIDALCDVNAPLLTQKVLIADLKAHPRNYRVHPPDQLAHLAQSIRDHGFYRNIVIAIDNTILAGHGTVEAAKMAGMVRVSVVRLPIAHDDIRALKVLTGDNEVLNLSESDDRALTNMLREIMSSDAGLLGTGFSQEQLALLTMVTRPASEIKNKDEAAEWLGMPDYQQQEKTFKLIVSFKTEEDRAEFVKLKAIHCMTHQAGALAWSAKYPQAEREDPSSVMFK